MRKISSYFLIVSILIIALINIFYFTKNNLPAFINNISSLRNSTSEEIIAGRDPFEIFEKMEIELEEQNDSQKLYYIEAINGSYKNSEFFIKFYAYPVIPEVITFDNQQAIAFEEGSLIVSEVRLAEDKFRLIDFTEDKFLYEL